MDKFRLIAEVRKRPILWNFQLKERPLYEISDNWKEVASSLGDDVTVESCKVIWKGLRDAYRVGKIRKRNRIESDKRKGKYNSEKDYDSKWVYYESMKYFEEVSQPCFHCSSDSEANQDANVMKMSEKNSRRKLEKRNERRKKNVKTRVQAKTQLDLASLETRRNNAKQTSPINDNNISAHSSTSETTCYELNIIDTDEEEFLKLHELENESILSHDKLYRKENKRKSPKRRGNKISTPKRNEKSSVHNSSLNNSDYIPSYSRKPSSSYYQINFMDEPTDQEESSKYQETIENCSLNDKESAENPAANNCLNEKPAIEIDSDANPINNEELDSKVPMSPKRQRLMRKNSTLKQIDIEDPVNQNSTLNDNDFIPTYSCKPKSSYYQINFIEDTDEEEPIISSKSLNSQIIEDKSCSKNIESSQQPDSQILNVNIKEEPAINIEADSYPIDDQESNALNKKEIELKSTKRQSSEKTSTTKQKTIENINSNKTEENLSTSMKENNNNKHPIPPTQVIDDPDYKFLLSFSSHLKSLKALQNLHFRAKMSDLILSFITDSCSSSTKVFSRNIQTMAVLSDPDCNFLSSFWPYMSSLTQLENLQFRSKMSLLMIDILSKDGNLYNN